MGKTKQGVRDLNNLGPKLKRKVLECEPGTHEWGPWGSFEYRWDGSVRTRKCLCCPVKDSEKRFADDDGWW